MIELKRCPYCGGELKIEKDGRLTSWECIKCRVGLDGYKVNISEKDLIAIINARVADFTLPLSERLTEGEKERFKEFCYYSTSCTKECTKIRANIRPCEFGADYCAYREGKDGTTT